MAETQRVLEGHHSIVYTTGINGASCKGGKKVIKPTFNKILKCVKEVT